MGSCSLPTVLTAFTAGSIAAPLRCAAGQELTLVSADGMELWDELLGWDELLTLLKSRLPGEAHGTAQKKEAAEDEE